MNAMLRVPKGGVRLILTLTEEGSVDIEHASSDDYGLLVYMLQWALDDLCPNVRVETGD